MIPQLPQLVERLCELERATAEPGGTGVSLIPGDFPEQAHFMSDQSSRRALFCTRRAAKTYSFGLDCINDGFSHPGANYLFLGLVRLESKKIFFEEVLKDVDRRYGLGLRFNESELTAHLPNGARIYTSAADANSTELRKKLGGKYRRVGIDEAQSWLNPLGELVDGTLGPTVVDWRGSITLMGTPGLITKGLFRDITPASVQAAMEGAKGTEPGWSLHAWDTSRNPHMASQWAAEIAELKARKPGIEQTPWFRRNYLGEWVVDSDALVYAYVPGRNDFGGGGANPQEDLPKYTAGEWHYALGIDLGWRDPTAFSVCAYHDHDPAMYVLEVFARSEMDLTDVASRVRWYETRYPLEVRIVDGANKQAVQEMVRRHDLALIAADKTGKESFIDLMNAEFGCGNIKLSRACGPLAEEYGSLIWDDRDKDDPIRRTRRQEHPACANHLADATLYAWRRCYQYLSTAAPAEAPRPGTASAYDAEAADYWQSLEQQYEERKADDATWRTDDWGLN